MFDYLAIGLFELQEQKRLYPYPPTLQYALNILAARAGIGWMSPSFNDVINIFRKPLYQWWQDGFGELPTVIDGRFPLLQNRSQPYLDEQVTEYLTVSKLGLTGQKDPYNILLLQHNELIASLVEILRTEYEQNPQLAQNTYAKIRTFISTYPFTTPLRLRRELNVADHYQTQAMYERVNSVSDLAMRDNCFLSCANCGVVVKRDGVHTSPKPSLCGDQCPGDGGWNRIKDEDDLMVLKRGILLRTYIPGQVEMRIYKWLKNIVQHKYPSLKVTLYPGVDRYDLHLEILVRGKSEVWAIDMKDHRSPKSLIRQLYDEPRLYNLGKWKWNRAYYVIPDVRLRALPTYLDELRNGANLPRFEVDVLSESSFCKTLIARLEGEEV